MQLIDVFQAYYDARKNKRNTACALKFELDYESELLALYDQIITNTYIVRPSICFINFRPVQREIFAADFRDRIVHHLIYNYISPIFEKKFLYDVYSCRKEKGTHLGIWRVKDFIKKCSQNYTHSCYILKLDIKGYFMAMNKDILWDKIQSGLDQKATSLPIEKELLYRLIRTVLYNDPTTNCEIRGTKQDWNGLPPTKSLFHAEPNCGLPIGNLTSQLFGNIYLNDFDHYVKRELGLKYYGRYVDDIVLVHSCKFHLLDCIEKIKKYLQSNLKLELHPNKIYLQQYVKGVKFLGSVIKPHRMYIGSRVKGNLYIVISEMNKVNINFINKELIELYVARLNSYLGSMKQYKTLRLRKKLLEEKIDKRWCKYLLLAAPYEKVSFIKTSLTKPSNPCISHFCT